jgi:hypothetical protein
MSAENTAAATGQELVVTLRVTVTGTTGDAYGNEAVTPQFVSEYLLGASDYIVPGVSITDATVQTAEHAAAH